MATDTDVANRCLLSLGLKSITDFALDQSYRARQVRLLYEGTRTAVLEEYDWPFAGARAELVRNATTPASGFDYTYDLPADFLRMRHVRGSDDDGDIGGYGSYVQQSSYSKADLPYELQEPFLLANAEEVWAAYTRNVTDMLRWPQHVADVLAYRLARDLAIPLTESESKEQFAERRFNKMVVRARGIGTDNDAKRKRRSTSSSWVAARYAGSGGHDRAW